MFIKEWSLNFIYHLSVNLMQPSQNNKAKKFKPNLFWKLFEQEVHYRVVMLTRIVNYMFPSHSEEEILLCIGIYLDMCYNFAFKWTVENIDIPVLEL